MNYKLSEQGLSSGLFVLSKWLVPPIITTITLLLLLQVYGVGLTDPYEPLLVLQFILVSYVFKEAYSTSMTEESLLHLFVTRAIIPWLMVISALVLIGFAAKVSEDYSRLVIFTWFIQAPFLVAMAQDIVNRGIIRNLMKSGHAKRAVIVGVNGISSRLADGLVKHQQYGILLDGYFEDRSEERVGEHKHAKIIGPLNLLAGYVKNQNIDVIYIALPIQNNQRTLALLDDLKDTTASIYYVPDVFVFDLIQSRSDSIAGVPVMALCETPFYGTNGLVKRFSDVFFALLALTLTSPIMVLIAIAVKVTSPGPVFFAQHRYGLDGTEIIVYKFRSMTVTENSGEIRQATKNDARLTKIGGFLRRFSLDELPQFINVLQGRMSMVGPRPHAVAHNEQYRSLIEGYMVRHKVRPGITGLAQVSGARGETRTVEEMEKRVHYDLEYLRNWSLALDVEILVKTVFTVFRDEKAY